MQRGLLTGIILGVAMAIFALQNTISVPVKFLWLKFTDVPLALILVISILTGVLVTAVFSFIDKRRLKNRIQRLLHKIKKLEDQVANDGTIMEDNDMITDDGMTIEGEPGNKFFDN